MVLTSLLTTQLSSLVLQTKPILARDNEGAATSAQVMLFYIFSKNVYIVTEVCKASIDELPELTSRTKLLCNRLQDTNYRKDLQKSVYVIQQFILINT